MRIGICGFPASGKSTVFRALSPGAGSSKAGVAYGNIKVPDARVDRLAAIFSPKKTTYAEITFMDVPGQPGRGGAAFTPDVIQAMRNADVLVHVVRAFDSPYHSDPPDPARDGANFNDELVLADLAILEKRAERWKKESKKGGEVDVNDRCVAHLEDGRPLRTLELSDDELATLQGIQLLSRPPLLTVYNIGEDGWEGSPWRDREASEAEGGACLGLCGELEAEIAEMPREDQRDFLEGLGLGEPARNEFIRTAFAALDLISFLTAGPDECRAWPIRRGFIRAEVYRLEDLEAHGTEAELKKAGKMRVEGKDYVVQDGDVMHVRFNV